PESRQVQTRDLTQVHVDFSRSNGDRARGYDVVVKRHQGYVGREGALDSQDHVLAAIDALRGGSDQGRYLLQVGIVAFRADGKIRGRLALLTVGGDVYGIRNDAAGPQVAE